MMPKDANLAIQRIDSPIGGLEIIADANGIIAINFDAVVEQLDSSSDSTGNQHTQQCVSELVEYFAGTRQQFSVPLNPQGTAFQLSVWQALQAIPYGQTCSYLDIAQAIGNPKSVRAVGGANGRNPIPIIIPCHRVIGRDGSLVGFSGGMNKKITLLTIEKAQCLASMANSQPDLFSH